MVKDFGVRKMERNKNNRFEDVVERAVCSCIKVDTQRDPGED
jgi:hypothetical protein